MRAGCILLFLSGCVNRAGRVAVRGSIFNGPPATSLRAAFFVSGSTPLLTPSFMPGMACSSLLL